MIVGKCCDENNKLNKERMFFVRKSLFYLWLSGSLFLITTATFAIMVLDVSSPRKDTLIRDRDVAHEIKNTGKNIIKEMNRYMSKIEMNTVPKTEPSVETMVTEKPDIIPKPTMPVPPESEIITESYSPWFKGD